MPHKGTITNLRYLKRNRLQSAQQLQRGWLREQIHAYGCDAVYFRHNVEAFKSPSGSAFDYVFGEQPSMGYWLSANVVTFMESMGDSVILQKWGIETDGDLEAYILMDDFTEQFRDLVGKEISTDFDLIVSGEVSGGIATIRGDVVDTANGLSGFLYQDVSGLTSGIVSGDFLGEYDRYEVPYHTMLYRSSKYVEQSVRGSLSGTWSGTLDLSGNGIISGAIQSNLLYNTTKAASDQDGGAAPHWNIAPKVGDFFRLDFNDDNHEEYEIRRVINRDLQADGLNPLLDKYVWRMSCVRRDPSYEEVIGVPGTLNPELSATGGRIEEEYTEPAVEHLTWIEDTSNDLFNYEIESPEESVDGPSSDTVYGGYSRDDLF